jgi:hypothetical protein
MKKILFTAIFLSALGRNTLYAQTDVASSIDTWTPDNYISTFVRNGELKCQGGKFLSDREAFYFYRVHKDKGWILLNSDLGAVNVFLKEEFRSNSAATQFLNQCLYLWLISTMGGDEGILDKGIPHKYANDSFRAVLEKYSSTGVPTYAGNKWKIQFYAMTNSGGVEQWLAEGNVFPLQISSCKRTIVLPNGTVKLPPAIR